MKTPAPLQYQVDASGTHDHTYRVTLTIAQPDAAQVVSLPVWIAGSYMVREFGRHLSGLQARQGRAARAVQQLDKTTWQIDCRGASALVLQYEVYAFDTSVRTAFLSTSRGFFNNTSLCLRVHGREDQAHHLSLVGVPRGWDVATAMTPLKGARAGHHFKADDYDELVDHPFEIGPFWRGRFKAQGIQHEFVVAGAWPGFDGERLLRDSQRICEEHIRFWHGARGKAPFRKYVFMLNTVEDGYGGLEHRASTALIAARKDLPRVGDAAMGDGYLTLLGLISHEYFHTWNVKRLKPVELCRIDHTKENYTELLWFFEGFTSYFDDLALVRCGLIDGPRYAKLLAKTATAVRSMPGRRVQSVAQASFDAWNKYYRQDENTPNSTISYYTKGAQVALCLDLTLRREFKTEGHTLDTVMRGLWKRCKAGPMREKDLLDELQAVTGRSWAGEIQRWVHSTQELPLRELLTAHGVTVDAETSGMAQRLGLRVNEIGGQVLIRGVLRGSAAEAAGLAAGDEWLGLDVGTKAQGGSWRLNKLDDLSALLGPTRQLVALVSRDKRLLRLPLTVPAQASHWQLSVPADRATSSWPGA